MSLVAAPGSAVAGVRVIDAGVDTAPLRAARFDGGERTDDAAQRTAFARVRAWIEGHAAQLDVVHAHAFDAGAFDELDGVTVPLVHTLHLPPLDGAVVTAATRAHAALAAVSEASASSWRAAGIRIDVVLPNGVDVGRVPFGAVGDGTLLFAGRIAPEKGVADAIRAARAAGRRLVIAGAPYDRAYADEVVMPLLGADVTLRGGLPRDEVLRLMSRASAVLMPVRWDEPFGLVALEGQAAGAPVVCYRRGGLPEVVRDGQTGILVEPGDERALVAAIERAGRIDRAACRRHVAESFPLARMLALHERLYAHVAPKGQVTGQSAGRNVSRRS